jgi:hypothetical protein
MSCTVNVKENLCLFAVNSRYTNQSLRISHSKQKKKICKITRAEYLLGNNGLMQKSLMLIIFNRKYTVNCR